MDVEKACLYLVPYLKKVYDKNKVGYAIDIGVGTFCFYCEEYKKLGFKTIAVEPLPNEKLKIICRKQSITLEECCIYTHNGDIQIYTGNFKGEPLSDLSSVKPDWWGSSPNSKTVRSITLPALLSKNNVDKISFLKVDTEGAEYEILNQLNDISIKSLPAVIQFEYGGGAAKKEQKGGWSDENFQNTLNCLNVLQKLNYEDGIMIDSSRPGAQYFEFTSNKPYSNLFDDECHYGNIIVFQKSLIDIYKIQKFVLQSQLPQSKIQLQGFTNKIKNKLLKILKP